MCLHSRFMSAQCGVTSQGPVLVHLAEWCNNNRRCCLCRIRIFHSRSVRLNTDEDDEEEDDDWPLEDDVLPVLLPVTLLILPLPLLLLPVLLLVLVLLVLLLLLLLLLREDPLPLPMKALPVLLLGLFGWFIMLLLLLLLLPIPAIPLLFTPIIAFISDCRPIDICCGCCCCDGCIIGWEEPWFIFMNGGWFAFCEV